MRSAAIQAHYLSQTSTSVTPKISRADSVFGLFRFWHSAFSCKAFSIVCTWKCCYSLQIYEMCVLDTKPTKAVSIIETDMNVRMLPELRITCCTCIDKKDLSSTYFEDLGDLVPLTRTSPLPARLPRETQLADRSCVTTSSFQEGTLAGLSPLPSFLTP